MFLIRHCAVLLETDRLDLSAIVISALYIKYIIYESSFIDILTIVKSPPCIRSLKEEGGASITIKCR